MPTEGWLLTRELAAVISRWCSGKYSSLLADSLSHLVQQLGLEHRAQFEGQFCRASYGHSTRFYKPTSVAEPTEPLFHGTSAANGPSIECFGLWPMRQRFVQLTTDRQYAQQIAARSQAPIVIQIQSAQVVADGIQFISTGPHVWLAEPIPAHLLKGWLTDVWNFGGRQIPLCET